MKTSSTNPGEENIKQETGTVHPNRDAVDQKSAELQTTLDMNEDDKVVQETLDKIKASGKSVFVIYRSNSIYENLGPAIIQKLESHSIPFILQAFPAGTDKAEIEERIGTNIPRAQEGIYISDKTCSSYRSHMLSIYLDQACNDYIVHGYQRKLIGKEFKKLFDEDLPAMDYMEYKNFICKQEVKKRGGKEFEDIEEQEKNMIMDILDNDKRLQYLDEMNISYGNVNFKDTFIEMFKECLSQATPRKIIIMASHIDDHISKEGLSPLLGEKIMEKSSMYNERIAQALSDLIKEHTRFEGEIIIKNDNNMIQEEDTEDIRYINDRHNKISIKDAKVLGLPLVNMAQDMVKYSLSSEKQPDTGSLTNYTFLATAKEMEDSWENYTQKWSNSPS